MFLPAGVTSKIFLKIYNYGINIYNWHILSCISITTGTVDEPVLEPEPESVIEPVCPSPVGMEIGN